MGCSRLDTGDRLAGEAPFLIDVTGNSANLYDNITWWDDANHLVNWLLLCWGIGLLLLRAHIEPS